MSYLRPWEDDEQWLPQVDPMGPRAANVAPPHFVTPPFVAPAPPPIAPVREPRSPRPAFDALAESLGQQPLRTDPSLKPSTTRKVLGRLAGAALAAGEGWVNASGRTRIDSNGGAALADGIVNAKFNKAKREYDDRQGILQAQAQVEAARLADERKAAESKARIGSETAQEAAARAAEARANRIETPKPIEVDGSLVSPVDGKVIYQGKPKAAAPPQTPFQAITRIRESDMSPTEKELAVKQVIADHNATNPVRPIAETTVSLAIKAAAGDKAADAALKKLGSYNDRPKTATPASGSPGSASEAADKETVEAVLHGVTKIESLPSARRERIARMVDKRRSELPPTLSTSQENDLAQAETTERLIDQALAYAEDGLEGVGPLAGRFSGVRAAVTGGGSKESKDVRQLIGNIRGTIQKLRAGTALSKTEKAQLDTYTPDVNEPEESVISKLNGLKNYIGILRGTTLKYATPGAGAPAAPPKVGDVVTGPDGKRYRIRAINGDDVDAEPVK